MPVDGIPISAVQDYANRAGELTHKLRRENEELLAHHAQIKEIHNELQVVCESLQAEGVIFQPEIPHFLLEALTRYADHTNPPMPSVAMTSDKAAGPPRY